MHAFGNDDQQIKGACHALVPEAAATQAHKETWCRMELGAGRATPRLRL
jgi:hypothetical protein